LLIESFARFLEGSKADDAGLAIVGKGRQEKELKALAGNIGVKDKVLFTGWLENPYPLMSRGDFLSPCPETRAYPMLCCRPCI